MVSLLHILGVKVRDKIIDNIRNNLSILRDMELITQQQFKHIIGDINMIVRKEPYKGDCDNINEKIKEPKIDYSDFK